MNTPFVEGDEIHIRDLQTKLNGFVHDWREGKIKEKGGKRFLVDEVGMVADKPFIFKTSKLVSYLKTLTYTYDQNEQHAAKMNKILSGTAPSDKIVTDEGKLIFINADMYEHLKKNPMEKINLTFHELFRSVHLDDESAQNQREA